MSTMLTLVRHGQSLWNALKRSQGQSPIPLSELGYAQAGHIAALLAKEVHETGSGYDVFYCSDLNRTRQTAAPIGEALKMNIHYDARWREISSGAWQGLDWGAAEFLDPENWAAHHADPLNVPMPGGESHGMLYARVTDVLAETVAKHDGQNILVVTHGGPMRCVLEHFGLWQQIVADPDSPPTYNTARTVLRVTGSQQAEIVRLNDVSHLAPELWS